MAARRANDETGWSIVMFSSIQVSTGVRLSHEHSGTGSSTYCRCPPSRWGGTTIRRAIRVATALPSPTTSSGGIYPDGDITHTYPTPGLYPTRIDITYSGEFSVNAGAWIPIPDTVTIAGAIQPLTVKTAHARLVAH